MASRTITHTRTGSVHTFTVALAGSVTFDEAKASDANNLAARHHGWTQRLSDAAALDKGAAPSAKLAAIRALAAYYEGGEVDWARKGGGGAKPFDVGLVVHALSLAKTGGDIDKANRVIDAVAAKRGIGREEAAKLFAADETVAVEMARIRARAGTKFDADEALLEIETEPEGGPETGADGE